MTIHIPHRTKISSLTVALSLLSCFGFTTIASATAISKTSVNATGQSAQVTKVITDGDSKIAVRLASLTKLSNKVNALKKGTPANKATLLASVTSTTNGLTALKAKLDADTTLVAATADRNAIVTDYRVYALVIPQVNIAKVADNQVVKEANLTKFAGLLQGKVADNAVLASQVTDMQSKITTATALSSQTESKVLAFKPNDYNADHTVLSGYLTDLKKAQNLNVAAYKEGLSITKALPK